MWLHKHYDDAIETLADASRDRYRRVAAQAPELRSALDAMREKDGRRFFLKNTAPNLAGAELQELVKAAIEGNGGRITTSQSPAPRDDGDFRQIVANVQFFATTPNLQRILLRARDAAAVPGRRQHHDAARPTRSAASSRRPGQEPEVNVQLDVSAWAMPEPAAKSRDPGEAAGLTAGRIR